MSDPNTYRQNPVVKLQTERLIILGFPKGYAIPDLSRPAAVKAVLDAQRHFDSRPSKHGADDSGSVQPSLDYRFLSIQLSEPVQIGEVTAEWDPHRGVCNVGYSVFPAYAGCGFATEAVQCVTEWLLAHDSVNAIVAETFADWAASIKIMTKVGMAPIEANIGPTLVRYGRVKAGRDPQLVELRTLDLLPFTYPENRLLMRRARRMVGRREEMAPLALLLSIPFLKGEPGWWWLSALGLSAYAAFFAARFYAWRQEPQAEKMVQFRDSGLFYADRFGFGRFVRWESYYCFRAARHGGLELWNGNEWYWLPPSAFNESLIEQAMKFLAEHGVRNSES